MSIFRDDDLHASLYSGISVDADSVESRALPGSTNIYLIRSAYFDAAWQREGGDADTLWTSQLPPRAVHGTRVLQFVRRLSVSFGPTTWPGACRTSTCACACSRAATRTQAVLRATSWP
jgi:hypothetical protein